MDNIFNIKTFAKKFKETVKWMLENNYAEKIKNDLQNFKENKTHLQNNEDSFRALGMIIKLIITNSERFRLPQNFDNLWRSFEEKYGRENFRDRIEEAKKELIDRLANEIVVREIIKRKIDELFNYLRNQTVQKFTEELYQMAQEGGTVVLGEKGRDLYLRDFGYWDRIPIDRHQMRFIIRSGIYHACSSERSDPLKKRDLQDALKKFCSDYLKDYTVEEIELGSAPGIVDIFIWSFCAKNRYNICKDTPQCKECPLKDVCLYALIHQQKS